MAAADQLDELGPAPSPGSGPRFIIRRLRLAHCKLGPERCEACREMDEERICLLDIDPPDRGMVQRRVIEVEIAGESSWREFDIVRTFDDEAEARSHAADHGIEIVDL
jgi:hypothetical protein